MSDSDPEANSSAPVSSSLFKTPQVTSTGLFASSNTLSSTPSFGSSQVDDLRPGLFSSPPPETLTNIFGLSTPAPVQTFGGGSNPSSSLFGTANSNSSSLFTTSSSAPTNSSGFFSNNSPTTNLFGNNSNAPPPGTSLFSNIPSSGSSLFSVSTSTPTSTGGLFSNRPTSSLFGSSAPLSSNAYSTTSNNSSFGNPSTNSPNIFANSSNFDNRPAASYATSAPVQSSFGALTSTTANTGGPGFSFASSNTVPQNSSFGFTSSSNSVPYSYPAPNNSSNPSFSTIPSTTNNSNLFGSSTSNATPSFHSTNSSPFNSNPPPRTSPFAGNSSGGSFFSTNSVPANNSSGFSLGSNPAPVSHTGSLFSTNAPLSTPGGPPTTVPANNSSGFGLGSNSFPVSNTGSLFGANAPLSTPGGPPTSSTFGATSPSNGFGGFNANNTGHPLFGPQNPPGLFAPNNTAQNLFPPQSNPGLFVNGGGSLFGTTVSIPIFEEIPDRGNMHPVCMRLTQRNEEESVQLVVNGMDTYYLSPTVLSTNCKYFRDIITEKGNEEVKIELDINFPGAVLEVLLWIYYRNNERLGRAASSFKQALEIYSVGRILGLSGALRFKDLILSHMQSSGFLAAHQMKFSAVISRKCFDIEFLIDLIRRMNVSLFGNNTHINIVKTSLALEWLSERECESAEEIEELKSSLEFKIIGERLRKEKALPGSINEYALLANRYPIAVHAIDIQQLLVGINLL